MRIAVAAAAFDRALHPMDGAQVDAELMLQVAAQPDRRGLGVERQADPAAFEVLRRADAGAPVDEDIAVAEHPRRKHRDGDERAIAAAGMRNEFGCRQLRRVEFLAADHAVENLPARREHDHVEIDAFDLHLARAQRLDAIVFAACVGELQGGHFPSFRAQRSENRNPYSRFSQLNGAARVLQALCLWIPGSRFARPE